MEVGSGVSLWMKSQKYLYCGERGGDRTGAGVSLQVAIAGLPPSRQTNKTENITFVGGR